MAETPTEMNDNSVLSEPADKISAPGTLRLLWRNLRTLFSLDFKSNWQGQERRLDDLSLRTDQRAERYEAAIDERIETRLAAIEERIAEYSSALDLRLEERLGAIETRLDQKFSSMDERHSDFSERIAADLAGMVERNNTYEAALDQRFEARALTQERNINEWQDAYQQALDKRVDDRFTAGEKSLDKQFTKGAKLLDNRFDSRSAANDARMDERLAGMDRYIDERFNTLEQRADDRMEAHERLVDGKLHSNRQDIVDRTDLLLQVFEQRLDQQRRLLQSIRESLHLSAAQSAALGQTDSSSLPTTGKSAAQDRSSDEGAASLTLSAGFPATDGQTATAAVPGRDEESPQSQLVSYRKLAARNVSVPQNRLMQGQDEALYDRILAWKKIAHEELDQFTPDEQETVDYILSFISDPRERAYTKQHLRRFVATLQRIPPAQTSSDRLLELGSLIHLAPAIRKFCGYSEVACADFWDSDEKIVTETLSQTQGSDSYTFELRNFNVEQDVFPYPDNHFRVVLCCELIEHLQRDPMHMLWECNRVLMEGGFLLLTTPNIASARAIEGLLVGCSPYLLSQYNLKTPVDQHNREYAPYEIGVALAAAGFTVVELETEDVWLRSNPAILELLKKVDITTDLRGDNLFALARKTSAPLERYPLELYIE